MDKEAICKNRLNLILSDACHQPDWLRQEFAMLRRYERLDAGGFVMVWDDLDRLDSGPVTRALLEISALLQRQPGPGFRLALNGWLGRHEHKHAVGVINNIGFSRPSSP